MKWETAKTWLIIAFLFLDCFLGWQVIGRRQAQVAYVEPYSDMLANTRTLLSEHGMSLDATVPQSHAKMSLLTATYANPSLLAIAAASIPKGEKAQLDETAGTLKTSDGTIQIVDRGRWLVEYQSPFVKGISKPGDVLKDVWNAGIYKIDEAPPPTTSLQQDKTNQKQYNFVQVYQTYPIFDASVVATVSDQALSTFQQTSVTGIKPVGDAKPTINALDALDSLASSIDKTLTAPDDRILQIELGYAHKPTGQSTPSSSLTNVNYWSPVWRITTSLAVYYVNAYTGEVNTPSNAF